MCKLKGEILGKQFLKYKCLACKGKQMGKEIMSVLRSKS